MDLGRLIREQVRDALRRGSGRFNAAVAVNHKRSGHTTSVYSDDKVTIIQRDGRTQVTRDD